jgi:hypothetical protein
VLDDQQKRTVTVLLVDASSTAATDCDPGVEHPTRSRTLTEGPIVLPVSMSSASKVICALCTSSISTVSSRATAP